MAQHVRVSAPSGSYDIVIESGLLGKVADYDLSGKKVIASNDVVAPVYGDVLRTSLPDSVLVTMPDGEQHKSLATVSKLYDDFIDAGLDRHGTVIALGGGVVGDTVGFAAATYLRGVRLVQMPTTLLAMVDSSAGGKVGVDLPQGKNLVGAFKQPEYVLIDPDVLATLSDRQWRCGMAELIKHGLLADPVLLEMAADGRGVDTVELIRRAVQVKVDIVAIDPFERGIRAYLNLGHTFAHAIERVTEFGWLHGEAVSVGLVAATRLSHRLGMIGAELPQQVEALLVKLDMPVHMGDLDPEAVYMAMGTDKKRQSGKLRFVLLNDLAKPTMREDVGKDDVIAVLEDLR